MCTAYNAYQYDLFFLIYEHCHYKYVTDSVQSTCGTFHDKVNDKWRTVMVVLVLVLLVRCGYLYIQTLAIKLLELGVIF